MRVKTEVVIDKTYNDKFEKDENLIQGPMAIHISVDPITNQKQAWLFTDDGKGNGVPILMFNM